MDNYLFEVSCRIPIPYTSIYNDALSVYSSRLGFPFLRDRFGFLNKNSPYNIYPYSINFPKSDNTTEFSELMDKRAIDIINFVKSSNLPLYIFYSGGVDSTAMLVAILKVLENDYECLRVIHTRFAYEENYEFMKILHKFKIYTHMVNPGIDLEKAQEYCIEHGIVLTGWCADQLFGSIIHKNYQDLFYKDWKLWFDKKDNNAIQQLEEAFTHYGMSIKTFGEFAWFMNFSCKYDFVKYTNVLLSGIQSNRMISFYDMKEMNEWSVSNFDILHKYSPTITEYYKKVLKEYIFSFDKNEDYYKHKGKQGSWYRYVSSEQQTLPINVVIMDSPNSVHTVIKGGRIPIGEHYFNACRDIAHDVMKNFKKEKYL